MVILAAVFRVRVRICVQVRFGIGFETVKTAKTYQHTAHPQHCVTVMSMIKGLEVLVMLLILFGDLKEIEKIQKRATKLVIKLKNKSYIDRLIYLNLPTLKYRPLRGDMIEVFKITHNIYHRTVSPDLPLNERANTRGNHYKLQNHTFHYDLRKHFFLHAL